MSKEVADLTKFAVDKNKKDTGVFTTVKEIYYFDEHDLTKGPRPVYAGTYKQQIDGGNVQKLIELAATMATD
jgi:hypothetical protein